MTRSSDHTPATVRAIAKNALIEVASSARATPSARAQAARTLLEMLGDLKPDRARAEERELHELSEAELDAEIARLGGSTDVPSAKPSRKRKRDQPLSE